MEMQGSNRFVKADVDVPAGLAAVWNAWTTEAGARAFFAPQCRIELRVGGPYEMYFDLAAPPGERGGEGVQILAFQVEKMLSFSWNAPSELPEVRRQHTHVVVRLAPLAGDRTHVSLVQDGWGEGGQWDMAFEYFTATWSKVVLPRLQYRFAVGPIDWSRPPFRGQP
jgi:uncharacterized protein YndB with AHSA1/START domain